jgi:hypothetical protein
MNSAADLDEGQYSELKVNPLVQIEQDSDCQEERRQSRKINTGAFEQFGVLLINLICRLVWNEGLD